MGCIFQSPNLLDEPEILTTSLKIRQALGIVSNRPDHTRSLNPVNRFASRLNKFANPMSSPFTSAGFALHIRILANRDGGAFEQLDKCARMGFRSW